MDLSIIIICRNEEAAIGACLKSLLEHTRSLEKEIILVDSASTDNTVQIASQYPVTIVSVDNCRELSPSVGRYVGTLYAKGKYVFYIDGDMVLIDGWLETALAQFGDEKIAAVAGSLYRVYPGEDLNYSHKNRYALGKVRYLAGSGVYRRDVLEMTGTFNPFMKGEEERELGFRVLQKGYSILRLDVPMVYHMEKARTKSELDEKSRYFMGVGQIFRHYGLQRISRDLFVSNKIMFFMYLVGFTAGLLILALIAMGLFFPAVLLLGAAALLGALLMVLKGGRKVYLFVRSNFLNLVNIVKGLGRGIPDAATFEAGQVEVVPAHNR